MPGRSCGVSATATSKENTSKRRRGVCFAIDVIARVRQVFAARFTRGRGPPGDLRVGHGVRLGTRQAVYRRREPRFPQQVQDGQVTIRHGRIQVLVAMHAPVIRPRAARRAPAGLVRRDVRCSTCDRVASRRIF